MYKQGNMKKNLLVLGKDFKAKLIYVAVLSALAGAADAATMPITGNKTFNNDTEYSFSESQWDDGYHGFIDDTADSTITIADDKTLTLKQDAFKRNDPDALNPESWISTAEAVYKRNNTQLTVNGGKLDIHMYENANLPTDVDSQWIDASGLYVSGGTLQLNNSITNIQGQGRYGLFLTGASSHLIVENKLNITLNNDRVRQETEAIYVGESDLALGNETTIDIKSGEEGGALFGVMLTNGNMKTQGTLTIKGDGRLARGKNVDNSAVGIVGIYDVERKNSTGVYERQQMMMFGGDIQFEFYGTHDEVGNTSNMLGGMSLSANRDYRVDGNISGLFEHADLAQGIYILGLNSTDDYSAANGWQPVNMEVTGDIDFIFNDIRDQVTGVVVEGGSVQAKNAHIGINLQPGNGYQYVTGIAAKEGSVVLNTADIRITGFNYLTEFDNEALGLSTIFGGQIVVEKDVRIDAPTVADASNAGEIIINQSGDGVAQLKGDMSVDEDSSISVNLGHSTASKTAYWSVTGESSLTKLTTGRGSRLDFLSMADADLTAFTGEDGKAVVSVKGTDPVLLYSGATNAEKTNIVLPKGWRAPNTRVINLVSSTGGFALNEADHLLTAEGSQADINSLKSDMTVVDTVSLARQSTQTLAASDYDLSLKTDNLLVATITGMGTSVDSVNPETDVLMESSVSAYGTFFAADDLFVDSVLNSRDGGHEGLFAAARGGRWHLDTDTTQKTNIVSGLVGYGTRLGTHEVGAYVEMGHASYDTRTDAQGGHVNGSGKHNYAGLGLYGNFSLPVEGWKLTGYVKAGALENKFDVTLVDEKVNFDRTSAYWGAHIGTHYDWRTENFRLRPFVSYFYDGRDSESYHADGHDGVDGADFHYDALSSHRLQAGTMFEYRWSDAVRPYVGLTYEQVLSAKAKGHASDADGSIALKSSDMEGGTGILSAGWTYSNEANDFTCEFGVTGYAGARRGVSAQLQAGWKF